MSRCWAAVIGGCSSKMSGEHLISKNQFGSEKITVQGFAWCPEPKEIPLLSAVANILCVAHNNALSPVDNEAKRVLNGLSMVQQRSARDRLLVAVRMPPNRWHRSDIKVSGDLFERWLLKTTINLALMGKPPPRGGIFDADGRPAKQYVEIAFGLGKFEPPEGFNWVAELGESVQLNQIGTVGFVSMIEKETGALVGALVPFHGNRLWLAAKGAPAIQGAIRHLREWREKRLAVKIRFTWS